LALKIPPSINTHPGVSQFPLNQVLPKQNLNLKSLII